VEHDRPLVVRAKEDERAVDREQRVRAESVDLALLVEDAPQLMFLRSHSCHEPEA